MKIKNITLQNFKGIKALSCDFTSNIIATIGRNGKGKTTFKEAVYAALTGVFPENPIMYGCDFCSVWLTLEDGTEIQRTIYLNPKTPNQVILNGKKVTGKSVKELIETKVGSSYDIFRTISSAEKIEELSSADLASLMVSVIPETLDATKISTYAGVLPPDVEAGLLEFFPEPPETFDIGMINVAYDRAFELRKEKKTIAANLLAKIKSCPIQEAPSMSIEDVEKKIDEIVKAEGAAEAEIKLLQAYETAVKAREKAEKNIADLKAEYEAIKVKKPTASEIQANADTLNSLQKKIIDTNVLMNTLKNNIEVFQTSLDNLNKPVCPLSDKIICTTDKSKVKEELTEMLESNREGLVYQEAEIKKLQDELEEVKKEKTDFDARNAAYEKRVILFGQIERAEKALPKVPDKPKTSIPNYEEEKRYYESIRRDALVFDQNEKDKKTYEELKKEEEIADAVCKLLAPKGQIISSLMEYYLKIFQKMFNTRAAMLGRDIEIKFYALDGVSYGIRTKAGGDFMPLENLSSGERTVTAFLLIDMFNQLTKQKMLLLDDIDKLDSEAFASLMSVITDPAVTDDYDIVVIAGVDHADVLDTIHKYPQIQLI